MKGPACSIITPRLGISTSSETTHTAYTPGFRVSLRGRKAKSSAPFQTLTTATPTTTTAISTTTPTAAVTKAASTATVVTTSTNVSTVSSLPSSSSTTTTTTITTTAAKTTITTTKSTRVIPSVVEDPHSTRRRVLCEADVSDIVDNETNDPDKLFEVSSDTSCTSTGQNSSELRYSLEEDSFPPVLHKDTNNPAENSCSVVSNTKATECTRTVTQDIDASGALQPKNNNCFISDTENGINFSTFYNPYNKNMYFPNGVITQTTQNSQNRVDVLSQQQAKKYLRWGSNVQNLSDLGNAKDCLSGVPFKQGRSKMAAGHSRLPKTSPSLSSGHHNNSSNCSQQKPGTWVIRRDYRSSYLHGTGYGERNNVWTLDDVPCHRNPELYVPLTSPDLIQRQRQENSNARVISRSVDFGESGDIKDTTPAKFSLRMRLDTHTQTGCLNKNKPLPPTPKCPTSQNKDTDDCPRLNCMPSVNSSAWLSKNLRETYTLHHDDSFREHRFLGNKLVSREIYRNRPISRELMYCKNPRVKKVQLSCDADPRESRRQSLSTTSGSSRDTCDLSLRPISQDRSEKIDAEALPPRGKLKSSRLSSFPSPAEDSCRLQEDAQISQRTEICTSSFTSSSSSSSSSPPPSSSSSSPPPPPLSPIPSSLSSSSPSSSSAETTAANLPLSEGDAALIMQNVDIVQVMKSSGSKHNSDSKEQHNDKTSKPRSTSPITRETSTDKLRSQELLDYFWSYQGMGRQMLGMKSPSFSLQSAMWETEKMLGGSTDVMITSDQGKRLNNKDAFSKFNRLPPILVTDYDAPLDTNRHCDCGREPYSEPNAPHEKKVQHTEKHDERGRRGRRNKTKKHRANQSLHENDVCDADHQEDEDCGRIKLRLVVKLPLQQKSEEGE